MQPKAYSYLRFSTLEQEHGDSSRRQQQAAQQYAAANGLELDEALQLEDRGVSAFRAKNARQGALGLFLKAIDDGLVAEGSYLLVENLDRVSRADPWEALPIFQQIINAGITIVTLQDGRRWSKSELRENPFRIFESLMVMIRANEESATKSRRLRAAWTNKRANLSEKRLTRICPAWLTPNESGSFDKVNDRVKVVRRVFKLAQDGMGQHAIAAELNRKRVAPFGHAQHWHRSYIKKVLSNPAVFGRLVPNEVVDGKRRPLEPVDDYYPPIVARNVFDEVQNLTRGGKSRSGRNTTVRNVLAGLAKCPQCGAGVTRWTDGKRPYLLCTGKRARTGCDYPNIRYELVERAVFAENGRSFELVSPPGPDDKAWRDAIALEQTIGEKSDRARALVEVIKKSPATSAMLVAEIASLETEITANRVELSRLQKRAGGLKADQWQKRIERLVAACKDADAQRANEALRLLAEKVEVESDQVRIFLLHGEITSLPIIENLLTDIEGYVG